MRRSAFAQLVINGPTQSATGSYTLTWDTCDDGVTWTQLRENNQVVTSSFTCPASFTANGRPDGSYDYQVEACFTSQFTGTFCFPFGDGHTVTVSAGGSGPPPSGDGVVRQGDANGNGLTDLYIAPETGTPFLMQQTVGQSFQLVSGLTVGQLTAYASWPQSSAFLVESDLNVSGAMDFMVRNVDVAIPGADEWVVFRNAAGDATSIMPLDLDRESFIGQLFAWSFDRNFFVDVALDQGWYDQVTQVGFLPFTSLIANQVTVNGQLIAGDPWNPSIEPDLCDITYCFFLAGSGWFAYLSVTFQELDFSNFHDQAIAVLQQIQQFELGNAVMRSVVDIFESVLGPITCNGVDPTAVLVWDANKPPGYFEDAGCFWYVAARYAATLNEDPTSDLRVELRTRPAAWPVAGFQHLSIYDPSESVSTKGWVSAFPSNGPGQALLGNGGYLEARDEHGTDNPVGTVIAGYLSPSSMLGSMTFSQQWALVLGAWANFNSEFRPYCISPDLSHFFFPDCSGFNSNGWAIGLVNAINFSIEPAVFPVTVLRPVGTQILPMTVLVEFDPHDVNVFPGVTVPVPGGDFQ